MGGRLIRDSQRSEPARLITCIAALVLLIINCCSANAEPQQAVPQPDNTATDTPQAETLEPAPPSAPAPTPPADAAPTLEAAPATGTTNTPAAPAAATSPAAAPNSAAPPSTGEGAPPSATLQAPASPMPVPSLSNSSALPHDLSPWGMFLAADIVVKAVMIGLMLASVLTWTVWIAKSLELSGARRSVKQAHQKLSQSTSLSDAVQRLGKKNTFVGLLIDQAELELRLSSDLPNSSGASDRVGTRLQQVVGSAGRAMNRGTGILATIGATAPFIGLFGTVWGIMNSFIGISKSQTTNLAIVAPGIAEALLATAIGLVAAIPAVIIYNHFSRSISAYKALLSEAAAEVMRLVSRDLERGLKLPLARAAAE